MLVQNCGYPDDMRILMESQSLYKAGYAVTVICPTSGSRKFSEIIDGVRVYRFPRPLEIGGLIGYLLEYAYCLAATFVLSLWVLLRHGFDVVHSRVPPDVYVFLTIFYKLLGKRYVADLQDSSPDLYQAQHDGEGNGAVHAVLCWLERESCRWADCLVTINESYRRMLLARSGIAPEKCVVVRNAPDPKFLDSIAPLEGLRPAGRTVIGYMGVIGVQDRVDVLLDALSILRDELQRTNFLAVIVGSGAALADVQRRSSELALDEYVRFVGFQRGEALLRHVASFDIGVTPDPSNPYNDYCSYLKTMEYMAMAKPVVCFDLPEGRVSSAGAALYAQPNDVRDLARQMARLMDDSQLRQRLGAIGRERAATILSWGRQEEQLLAAYDSMLCGVSREVRAADDFEQRAIDDQQLELPLASDAREPAIMDAAY